MRKSLLILFVSFILFVPLALAKHPDPADFPTTAKVTESKANSSPTQAVHNPDQGMGAGGSLSNFTEDVDVRLVAEIEGKKYTLKGYYNLSTGTYQCRIVKKKVQFLVPVLNQKDPIVVDFKIDRVVPLDGGTK